MNQYVHGYSPRETVRLNDQSAILKDLLHSGTVYPPGSRVLEAGCGVAAQTVLLGRDSPQAEITSVDISRDSLQEAKTRIAKQGIANVCFSQADIFHLPFAEESFHHVFVCFVLEHLAEPLKALAELRRVLKTGGTITVIEGDHGSCFWHPETKESLEVWHSLITAQARLTHNALIGRQLYPLLTRARFKVGDVSPRWVYTDSNSPELMDGVVNRIIVPMVETAKERAFELGLVNEHTWNKGINDLRRSGESPHGTFFYTWFKGTAVK